MSLYPSGKLSGSGHQMVVNIPDAQLFREIRYEHFDEKAPSWTIDSIVFSYRKIDRIFDKSLPKVPDGWLEGALQRALGEPFVIGFEDDCLVWKITDSSAVFYVRGRDSFELSALVTSPADCSVTEEQQRARSPRKAK